MRLTQSIVGDDEINFPQKLLITNRQVPNLCKAFENISSTDIKLSKTQLSKMVQLGGFLGRILKNVIMPLAKSVLIPLGLTQHYQQQMQEYIKKS